MKVMIYTHDPILTLVRSKEESIDLFGEDCEEDLVEVPDAIAIECIATYQKLIDLSQKLKIIRDHHDSNRYG
jgi:hypothetical protein